MRVALVLLLVSGFAAQARATSGYVREPGAGYTKLSFTSFASNAYFTLDGELRDGGQTLTQRALSVYAEYGVLPHVAVAVSFAALRVNAFSRTDTALGVGDLWLEVKAGETFRDWHLAIAVQPELPTGRSRAFVPTSEGGRINLPTGDGELNVWTRLAVARGIAPLDAYVSADIGYNVRTEGFTDQLGFSVEAGHHLLQRLWLSARLRGLFALNDTPNPNVPFLYGEGTEYIAIDGAVAIPFYGPFSATLDYTNIIGARRNTYGGSIWAVGLAAEW